CVNDGFCSLEQADLIQLHVEKKLRKLYKIDEIIGKSLSKSLINDDNNEDEYNDEDNQDKKSLTKTNDEHTHRLNINTTNDDKTIHMETTSKNVISKNDNDINISSSINLNNQKSISPSKSNLSPGEIKPISPSSLSETSPISN
ncbi:unnamed protein product, partial [Rotaria sordida]